MLLRFGAVRFVAIVAGHSTRVLGGDYLGKRLGLGLILLMAAHAKRGDGGKCGFEGRGVIGMFGERAMAGFARDVGVLALCANLGLGIVTYDASVLACIGDRVLADGCQRAGAIVAVLTEALGHDDAANHHKDTETCQQDKGRPDQVSGIAE
jgi:hypothetical protein